ncbi:Uncharacterised protein [Chlamydia trachomatis]|nr:Uncharacterised protein [Chlamydia trachomatis]
MLSASVEILATFFKFLTYLKPFKIADAAL